MQFTPKDWIFAYFSFLGVGKLILAGLYIRRVVDTAEKFIGGDVDTGEQFFGGVIDTVDKNFRPFGYFRPVSTIKNLSPVSLTSLNSLLPVLFTPAININSQISPRIFEKIQNDPNGILMGLGDTDSWKKPELENLLSDSLSCYLKKKKNYASVILLQKCVFFMLHVTAFLIISLPFPPTEGIFPLLSMISPPSQALD